MHKYKEHCMKKKHKMTGLGLDYSLMVYHDEPLKP